MRNNLQYYISLFDLIWVLMIIFFLVVFVYGIVIGIKNGLILSYLIKL